MTLFFLKVKLSHRHDKVHRERGREGGIEAVKERKVLKSQLHPHRWCRRKAGVSGGSHPQDLDHCCHLFYSDF